jgi:hypothetical protein
VIEVPVIPAYKSLAGWEPDSATTITRNGVPLLDPEIGELISNVTDGTLFVESATGPREVGRAHARINGSGSHLKARRLNFVEGAGIALSIALDSINDEIDVTIAATGGSATWGAITGTISAQTDLKNASVTPPAADPAANTIQLYLDHLATSKTNATQAVLPLGGLLVNGSASATQLGSIATISPGTNAAALNGLTGAADRGVHFTGAGAMALHVLTSLARTLLADATPTAMQTTLGGGATGRTIFAAANVNAVWDHLLATWQDVASAATVGLSATVPNVRITGTTNITQFTITNGETRNLRFAGALTLTHDGVNISCQGNASILTAAGDTCTLFGTGTNRCIIANYTRAASAPWSGSGFATTVTEQTNAAGWRTQIEVRKHSADPGALFLKGDSAWAVQESAPRTVEYDGTVKTATIQLLNDSNGRVSGSCTVTIKKINSAGTITTLGTVALSSQSYVRTTGLSWAVSAGEGFIFTLDPAPSTGTRIVVSLGYNEA